MSDYTEFDAALLALIAGGMSNFTRLSVQLDSLAKPFCVTPSSEPFRVVDRRLQALRKRHLVAFNSKTGWSVVAA